jgi:hypothetical protein
MRPFLKNHLEQFDQFFQKKSKEKKRKDFYAYFLYKLTMQSQKKINFSMSLHRKYCKEGTIVITQF